MDKKLIYICSPLRGDDLHDVERNKSNTRTYCKFAVLKENGVIPIAPHIYLTQFFNDNIEKERAKGLEIGLDLLKRCSEIWVFGERVSDGMAIEITTAADMGLKIRWFDKHCTERVRSFIDSKEEKSNGC